LQADVECLFKETIDTFSGVIAVVNCAGVMLLSPIARGDFELFDKLMPLTSAVNFGGEASCSTCSSDGRIIVFLE
jgi:NAD(P)-dependent dehydrogenase (short-subunit alcohol dehydrogenase family)